MNFRTFCCACYLLSAPFLGARGNAGFCGTYPENWRESLDQHEKAERRRAAAPKAIRSAAPAPRRDSDIGNVAVLENDDSIFGRRNPFNLDRYQATFVPTGNGYQFTVTPGGFDQVAVGSGDPVTGLTDDDSRRIDLPFPFPFYGVAYREAWLNSDGNLTFLEGDKASSARSLGRMSAGPPRISPLFSDLDPSIGAASIRTTVSGSDLVVTWLRVPEFSDSGNGRLQTFQVRLSSDGRIQMAWEGVNVGDGVVGISPGDTPTPPFLASFLQSPSGAHNGMIAERFGDAQALDLVAAARRFYQNHDDAYDYLAFFNSTGVSPGAGVIAFETSVRTNRRGIGDSPVDVGRQYGSANRLQAVLNMGPVSNYPSNPNSPHPLRFTTGDTGLTVFAHELGHLFLAFSSIRTPGDPAARPMLGRQLFHWNFRFNSEASLLEGNRIRDNGPNANPRFTTTATVEGFSPLDQYLMGMREPEAVPPSFLVEKASTSLVDPRVGVSFNGDRRDVSVGDLIAIDGPRIPDHTLEQRRYRVAIVLIVPEGTTASATDLALLERYREALESAWPRYSDGRGAMEASIRRAVRLSIEPASGVIAGSEAVIGASIAQPATSLLTIALRPQSGLIDGPSSIVIPAGARTASAAFRTLRPGVEIVRAEPLDDSTFMNTEARLQISTPQSLSLRVVAGDRQLATPGQMLPQPVVVKLTDNNDIPYPNVRIFASGGAVTPVSFVTGADGRASFQWTTSAEAVQILRFTVDGGGSAAAEARALGKPAFAVGAVLNAASFQPGMASGGIATIFGVNLGEPSVTVEGAAAPVLFANDSQINFVVPRLARASAVAVVEVRTALGSSSATVPFLELQPGLFFDPASGRAAAIDRGSRVFELYGTGLGAATDVTAQVGKRAAEVLFAGLAPGFAGLYQVNIRVDAAVPAGDQPVSLTVAGVTSNEAKLAVGN